MISDASVFNCLELHIKLHIRKLHILACVKIIGKTFVFHSTLFSLDMYSSIQLFINIHIYFYINNNNLLLKLFQNS